jgi:hypothetical protein
MQPDFSQIGPFLLAALVVFAVYRRLRRSFGPQALRPARLTVRIVLLAAVACALAPLALESAQMLAAELVGAALGLTLGVWSAQAAHAADPSRAFAAPSMVKSPLTVGILFVLVGYYAWYYGWLLWKSKHLTAADLEAAPATTAAAP